MVVVAAVGHPEHPAHSLNLHLTASGCVLDAHHDLHGSGLAVVCAGVLLAGDAVVSPAAAVVVVGSTSGASEVVILTALVVVAARMSFDAQVFVAPL